MHDQPHCRGRPEHGDAPTYAFPRQERTLGRLHRNQSEQRVERELTMQKPKAEYGPAPSRTRSGPPDEQCVHKRGEAPAVRREHLRRCGRGWQGKEQNGYERDVRAQADLALERPQEEECDDDVEDQQRQLERRDRYARDGKHGSGEVGVHAEHAVLAVEEHREGATLDQTLRHQPGDGLVGVEEGLFPEDEDDRAQDHEQNEHGCSDRPLTVRQCGSAAVHYMHSDPSAGFYSCSLLAS